ncbi:hypothetical protein U3516DRAFT_200514 [Neocallimastix sp. 'constans']
MITPLLLLLLLNFTRINIYIIIYYTNNIEFLINVLFFFLYTVIDNLLLLFKMIIG